MHSDPLKAAVKLLRHAGHVVVLTGAGISTPSGIPDFRSPESGLWGHDDPYEVASIYGFKAHPERFYNWIRPLAHTILDAVPNAAHLAIARMETTGHVRSVITQNIDMLHTGAGSRTVYELHGNLREATCIRCFSVYPAQPFIDAFLVTNSIPRCPRCGHPLKPNLILLGEQLPAHILSAAQIEARRCDVMLVVGTSLSVYPAAGLPAIARQAGASLIFVNLTETPIDPLAQAIIRADVLEALPRLAAALESE
jgi:NAD-dependent deacetylase